MEYIFIPFGVFQQMIGVDFASEVGHIALHGSSQIAFPYLTVQVVDVRSCYCEHCPSPNLLGNSPRQPQCCPSCRLLHLSRGHRAMSYVCISTNKRYLISVAKTFPHVTQYGFIRNGVIFFSNQNCQVVS